MKKLFLFVLSVGVFGPVFAAPGPKMPPPPPFPAKPVMMDADWDVRFKRHEAKIKRFVRKYKKAKPGSYKAGEAKKDLSKQVARLRKDQLAMAKENLRTFKKDLKELQEGIAHDQRVYRRRWVFLNARARAIFAHQINMRRHSLNAFRMQVADLERTIKKESRSSRRARWVARKTVAAIKFNGDMKVFFARDPLFSSRGMSMMLPPPPPPPAPPAAVPGKRPGPSVPHHRPGPARPSAKPGDKAPTGGSDASNPPPAGDSSSDSSNPEGSSDESGTQLGPTGNQPDNPEEKPEEAPEK